MVNIKLVVLLLKFSIASVFLYAAIAATLQPFNWIGFIPEFALDIAPAGTLLAGFSLYQLLLTVWVLSGWKGFYAGLLSSATLTGIIVTNWGNIDVVFRDFAILFAALALSAASYSKNAKSK